MTQSKIDTPDMIIALTSDIVAAHVSNNSVSVDDIPVLISSVHSALSALGERTGAATESPDPAVPIRSSVKSDHLVCLDCGKKMKMLKRHLMTMHDMTPDDYRARWNLSADYPMVSPEYASTRRELAMKIGLGGKPGKKRARRKNARGG